MRSRHICPVCGRTEFLTVAHVAQTWRVNWDGEFIEEISTDETTAPPDDGNIWTCAVCGAEAVRMDELPEGHVFPKDVPHSDDDLLTTAGDRIDNAVWYAVLVTSISANKTLLQKAIALDNEPACFTAAKAVIRDPKNTTNQAVLGAMSEIALDRNAVTSGPYAKIKSVMDKTISYITSDAVQKYFQTGIPDWNMEIIGTLTDLIEKELMDAGIDTCHPWNDCDEHICYAGPDRCRHCRHDL